MPSPIVTVLEQIEAGTPTVFEMSQRTGMSTALLQTALDHLIYTGRVSTETLGGCSAKSCSGCALTDACALLDSRRPIELTLPKTVTFRTRG